MAGLRRLLAGATVLPLLACSGADAPSTSSEAAPTGSPVESQAAPEGGESTSTSGETSSAADAGASPADRGEVPLELSTIASGLEAPWEIAVAGERIFLTERDSGAVLELADDGTVSEVAVLDVQAGGEGGLLGLAVDPGAEEPRFYAYLTTAEDNRVVRFEPGEEPTPVLTGIPSARIHNGGRIAFGPDGLLYVATGDAGQEHLAQDPGSLAGKILRITPDGEVPDDNPIPGSPVYSLGHRNPQGLAWMPDGTLYASEFGPDRDDEVNRIGPGANYGWPAVTGQAGVEGFNDPVFVQQPPEGSWSGLAILDGGAIPQWEGDLFLASLRGQRLWRLRLGDDGEVEEAEALLVGEHGRLRQVVQGPDGALWLLTSNRDGRGSPIPEDDRILRLGPPTGR